MCHGEQCGSRPPGQGVRLAMLDGLHELRDFIRDRFPSPRKGMGRYTSIEWKLSMCERPFTGSVVARYVTVSGQ